MSFEKHKDGEMVTVVYGSSQNENRLRLGEAAIEQSLHPAA